LNIQYWEDLEDFEVRERRPKRQQAPAVVEEPEEETEPTGPLASFYADELIVGEPVVVKSGKEATVYCCRAHPSVGKELLAAKVYCPRRQRSFKNDAVYQQGRTTLDSRLDRAMHNKSKKGREVQFGMWIGHEFGTLSRLHAAGADVPKPYASAESALLMDYCGEWGQAAPQLYNVELSPEEAPALFQQMLRNLAICLDCDRVHGDLSAYNILYWQGRLCLIDFPQAVDPLDNQNAFGLFARDVANVCEYFALYDIPSEPLHLARTLWIQSGRRSPQISRSMLT
jgi:RIO kinase 1